MDTHTLSICTGYGGIELGLKPIMPRIRTVCYVENEIGASKILGARIRDGILDDAPIWTDLRTFDAKAWRGKIHLVTGGFPCQPHSIAGKKQGADDPRELSGEVLRIAEELGCPTLFLENVETIKRFYWDNIRPKLHRLGYKTQEGIFSAEEVGAPHRRRRFFILAYHDNSRVSTFGYEGQREGSERTEERQDRSLFELAGQGQDAQLENTIVNGNRGGVKDFTKKIGLGGQTAQFRLRDQVSTWATPASRDWKGMDSPGKQNPAKDPELYLSIRPDQTIHEDGSECTPKCRRLSPHFAEWLMGLPHKWTDSSEPLAMESFLQWQEKLGRY